MFLSGDTTSSRYIFYAFCRYNSVIVVPRNPIQEISVNLNISSFRSNSGNSHQQKRNSPFVDGVKWFYNVVRPNKVEVVEDLKICSSRLWKWLSENKKKISISIGLLGCGCVITLGFGNMETVPYTKRSRFVLLPPSLENLLGESLFKDTKLENKEKILSPTNPESIKAVSKIAREIFETARCQNAVMEGFKWEVIVVDEPKTVNAYCLPGGKIVVFTGLLTHFREDAEIATVIGHEVGHAVARHGAEKINKFMWLKIIQLIFYQFYPSDVVNKMSSFFLELPYSRRMEMEADYIGLVLMSCAGYDPRVAPKVYEKLGKIGGGSIWALDD